MSDFAILGTRIYEKSYVGNDFDEAQLDALFLSEGKIIVDVIKALEVLSDAKEIAKRALVWSNVCMDFDGHIRIFFDREASVLSIVMDASLFMFGDERMGSLQELFASADAFSVLPDDDGTVTVIVKYR